MQHFTGGPAASMGFVGDDGPPLSPETIGRAPSIFDPPVKVRPLAELIAEKAKAAAAAPPAEQPDTRRLVLRLLGGEELELGSYDDPEAAVAAARGLVARLSEAEASGQWPEVDGRFVRPGSVATVDVRAG